MRRLLAVPSVLTLALLTLAGTGCRSRLTGNEGNLEFSYPADDAVLDFNKPIAVGARLDLTVAEAGTHKRVELTSASTDDPSVLDVVSHQGDTVVLEGKGSGGALVTVEATVPAGTRTSDSVNMLARVPDVLKLAHTCTSAGEAAYLVDQDVLLPYDLEMQNGQSVIGYGYHPFAVAPSDALVVDRTTHDQQFVHAHTAASPATVTITSQIDDATETLVLVEASQIDGAMVGPGSNVPTQVGHEGLYHVLPTVGGTPVCQPITTFTAVSDDPDVCTLQVSDPGQPQENEYGWVRVTGLSAGECVFTVTYPAGNDGAGASAQLSLTIST